MKFLTIILLFVTSLSLGQSIRKDADLGFLQANDTSWTWLSIARNRHVDTKDLSARDRPYLKILFGDSNFVSNKTNMYVRLFRSDIILPMREANDDLTIKISSRGIDLKESYSVSVAGFDENNKQVYIQVQNNLGNQGWNFDSFKGIPLEARSLTILIEYIGNQLKSQALHLQPIQMMQKGKDISDIPLDRLLDIKDHDTSIKKEDVIPLSGKSGNIVSILPKINEKSIIGLGECTHGSLTVVQSRLSFLKEMILLGECQLLAMEYPVYETFVMDSFAQGTLDSYHASFVKDIALSDMNTDIDEFMSFLLWLREYNKNAINKISIVGLEPLLSADADKYKWMNFFYTCLAKEKSKYYLQDLDKENLESLIDRGLDTLLFSKESNAIFRYIFQSYKSNREQLKVQKDFDKVMQNRDLYMAQHSQFYYDHILQNNSRMIIYAHSGHLMKTPSNMYKITAKPTLGSLLVESFQDRYFNISFQFGKGEYRYLTPFSDTSYIHKIDYLPKYSLEYNAFKIPVKEDFYISSEKISKKLVSRVDIPVRNSNYLYSYKNLNKDFDGYVFVKESKAAVFPSISLIGRYRKIGDLKRKMRTILRELNKL